MFSELCRQFVKDRHKDTYNKVLHFFCVECKWSYFDFNETPLEVIMIIIKEQQKIVAKNKK
jgi:hypothetical protein